MARKLKQGELGEILKHSQTKHVCPTCPQTFDLQQDMVEHFIEEHDVEILDQNSSRSAS